MSVKAVDEAKFRVLRRIRRELPPYLVEGQIDRRGLTRFNWRNRMSGPAGAGRSVGETL
jgi:hypothetical protein